MDWLRAISWKNITFLIEAGWNDLRHTDFYQIEYSNISLAMYMGIFIAGAILLKLSLPKIISALLGRNRKKYSLKVSGHFISGWFKKGIAAKFIFCLPFLSMAVPLTAMLLALAEPFLPITKDEKRYVETRVRVDFRDVSGSMTSQFPGSKKTKAEVAHDAHLEFLRMRAGKGDRTSFWVFSNNPYLIQGFTVDESIYYQQVYDAPWELGPGTVTNPEYSIPLSRYLSAEGEGGTMMSPALMAAVSQFEEDDKRQGRSTAYRVVGRAVLLLTDAEISDFDIAKIYIDALRKKKVSIYLIFIGQQAMPSYDDDGNLQGGGVTALLEEIQRNGGRYFFVASPDSLKKAYLEIDRLEKVKIELEKKIYKTPLFYKYILIAFMALMMIIPAGMFLQVWEH